MIARVILLVLSPLTIAPPAAAFVAASSIILCFFEFLLLLGREHRPDLRHRVFHHRFGFLHRLTADGFDLWPRLIYDRLHLGPLFRREIQLTGHFFERTMTWTAAMGAALVLPILRALSEGAAPERKSAQGGNCDEFEFHILCVKTGRTPRRS